MFNNIMDCQKRNPWGLVSLRAEKGDLRLQKLNFDLPNTPSSPALLICSVTFNRLTKVTGFVIPASYALYLATMYQNFVNPGSLYLPWCTHKNDFIVAAKADEVYQ